MPACLTVLWSGSDAVGRSAPQIIASLTPPTIMYNVIRWAGWLQHIQIICRLCIQSNKNQSKHAPPPPLTPDHALAAGSWLISKGFGCRGQRVCIVSFMRVFALFCLSCWMLLTSPPLSAPITVYINHWKTLCVKKCVCKCLHVCVSEWTRPISGFRFCSGRCDFIAHILQKTVLKQWTFYKSRVIVRPRKC